MSLFYRSRSSFRKHVFLHSGDIVSCRRIVRIHYGQLPVVGAPVSKITVHAAAPPPDPSSSEKALPSPHHTESQLNIYEGPYAQTAKRLKLFSVSSLAATIALCPFIFILDAGISTGMRGGLAVAAVATSGSSTALVQWCLGSYVRKITIPNPSYIKSETVTAPKALPSRSTPVSFETLSFWGSKRITTVKVSDLEPSSAPFSTIRIRPGQKSVVRDGKGRVLADDDKLRKRFYLHSEFTEEEPLRTIMAEVQQNQHLSTEALSMRASSPQSSLSSSSETVVQNGLKEEGLQTRAPMTEGMSDRIELLKRKAAENAKKGKH
ncbi:hypothetical protein BCR41DRAFT_327726 [Lobosporangium transversale]|uniref:Transmembrane protein n=1 Tax=Lobosporangium transversale TaxID=64571 RepID=A0A1Y2GA64_9FUNG|nr:hypothetical protein BCR41DRAFT_327726 [Lobosporangium transversale]ORZ05324.1 hypothetical protein BCR41DRAFT_327726 [Lobosporangium transversale]|eukprot:XP_021877016.1 hypothetical protein BCR41DRAFT_327726 [Lobosporangium transversale]